MKTLRIHNWDKWQSYRRDRGQPPWIKVHREIMRKVEWVALTDAQRGQLVAIWLLAADRDGVIPASPQIVQKLCFMDSEPDLNFFIDQGFICDDDGVASEWRQGDAKVTNQRQRQRQRRDRGETEKELSPNGDCASPESETRETVPAQKIIDLFHEKCPSLPHVIKLTPARRQAISARWRNELKGMDQWERFFQAVEESDFLSGRSQPGHGRSRPFLADLDFLIKQANCVKIMEGKYDD